MKVTKKTNKKYTKEFTVKSNGKNMSVSVMGRPRLDDKVKKGDVIKIRVQSLQADKIKAYADANNIKASQLIRDAIDAYINA